jgi:TolB protein
MSPRKRFFTLTLLVGVVAVSSALAGRSALSASAVPAKNGRIAFKRYLDSAHSTGALFTVDASGKGVRQVTKPDAGVIDDQPDWSPDGSLIVFHRTGDPWAIYTVRSDGSELTRVTPTTEDGEGASFLPDGRHVVYTRATGAVRHFSGGIDQIQHSDIVVRDATGANPRVLLRSPSYAGDYLSPHFSPDGSRFVYVRSNSPLATPAGGHALFVAATRGGGQRQITPWSLDAGDGPDWSPDGKLILFRSHEEGGDQSQIYVVRPDGGGLQPLTQFESGTTVLSYSFSPDGKRITFAKSGLGGEPDIFVMQVNGTDIRPVTRNKVWDSAPDWGPAA